MKLLVTGALGHIGSSLIRALPQNFKDSEIILVDDLSTQRYCSLFNLPREARFQFIEAKVQSYDLKSLLHDADAVIHLAAMTDAAGTADKPELVHDNNFLATQAIANACLEKHIPLIFPSSTSVYGSQSTLVDEDCRDLQPQSPYAETKIKEEHYLLNLAKQGLKVAICRLGTIYGISPGMRFHTAVNRFCWQAVMGQSLTVWETALDQKRPYLCLYDVVKAFCWIIENKLFQGSIYNIVSGNHTVREVVETIQTYIPKIDIKLVQHKIMNQLSYEVSNEKFKATGFSFKGDLSIGIQDTINLLNLSNARQAL